jgi:hypothetical protein
MSFSPFVFGTPAGFEFVFPNRFDGTGEENDKSRNFIGEVSRLCQQHVYVEIGNLLDPPNNPNETPLLWVIDRLGVVDFDGTDTEHELIFVGCYKHAYSIETQRSGFYGAGCWFNRHEAHIAGQSLQDLILMLANNVFKNCSDNSGGNRMRLFARGLANVQLDLNATWAIQKNRLDTVSDTARSSIFIEGNHAYVQLVPEESEKSLAIQPPHQFQALKVVAKFLDAIGNHNDLLRFETIYASTAPSILQSVKNGLSSLPSLLKKAAVLEFDNLGHLNVIRASVEPLRPISNNNDVASPRIEVNTLQRGQRSPQEVRYSQSANQESRVQESNKISLNNQASAFDIVLQKLASDKAESVLDKQQLEQQIKGISEQLIEVRSTLHRAQEFSEANHLPLKKIRKLILTTVLISFVTLAIVVANYRN